ncbi:MAG: two component transcriptional regulator, AraC family, partial [Paenibacillus sp.]|nr:two component transcriptional regulator, AraC family [Paenibacillus sp.]
IQSHPVDVILTDIKMTFVSGLELAKYVHDHGYPIKMILISGYKEFELAQQALQFKVAHYLLKPTRLSEVHQVFRDMKAALDQEKAEKEMTQDIHSRNEEILAMLRRQFFSELIAGTIAEREEIGRRLQFIRLSANPDTGACCLYSLRIPQSGRPRTADHEANRVFRFIQRAYRHEQDGILHIPLHSEAGVIRMAAIDLRDGISDVAYIEMKVKAHFETVKGRIFAVLGHSCCLEAMQSFERLMNLVSTVHGAPKAELVPHESVSVSAEPIRFDPLVIQKAKSYIQEKFNQDLSLEDVADHVYLSPVYFSRLFKKQTGRNFTDYVTEIRIARAMEYLREPQYKVYEISTIIGYKSTKYFFKLFKQYAGCTPTEYRNMLP